MPENAGQNVRTENVRKEMVMRGNALHGDQMSQHAGKR